MEMLNRMQTGRLKVAAHLSQWFEEFRMYHRKDGRIVKEHDDLLCATRYALMMLKSARTSEHYAGRRSRMAEGLDWNPLDPYENQAPRSPGVVWGDGRPADLNRNPARRSTAEGTDYDFFT